MGVESNLLLVCVLERLRPLDPCAAAVVGGTRRVALGGDGGAAAKAGKVPREEVHQDCLGDVIGVVPRHDMADPQHLCAPV